MIISSSPVSKFFDIIGSFSLKICVAEFDRAEAGQGWSIERPSRDPRSSNVEEHNILIWLFPSFVLVYFM